MKSKLLFILACLVCSLPIAAQETTRPLQANTQVARSCSLVHVDTLSLGVYDPVLAHDNSSKLLSGIMTIRVKCTAGTTGVALRLDKGLYRSGTIICDHPTRYLRNDGSGLQYRLFNASATPKRTWGCDGSSGDAMTEQLDPFTDSLATRDIKIEGTIRGGLSAKIGNYSDTINVQLIF